MNPEAIKQALQTNDERAIRVTRDDLRDNIVSTEYVKHISTSGQVLRWAVLTTRNGFAATGRPSCAVSSANDDEKRGQEVAYQNAEAELWQLMGYELRSRAEFLRLVRDCIPGRNLT